MIKNKIKFKICALSVITTLVVWITPSTTFAETHVYSDDIKPNLQNITWDKAGSPYILKENIDIPESHSLNIREGVEIVSASTTGEPNTIQIAGKLTVTGTSEYPVKFTNLDKIYLSNNQSMFDNVVFDKTGIVMQWATSTMLNTTIKNTHTAIDTRASKLDILNSKFINNSYGVVSNLQEMFFQVKNSNENIGGEGNAFSDLPEYIPNSKQNIITISNSSFIDNKYYSVSNKTLNTVNARDNWWGRVEGPKMFETFGQVDLDPWLTKDPDIIDEICCSSVIFFPGLQASRLYVDEPSVIGNTTNTLWEPNTNEDVRKMYMDQNGNSINKSIYTKDIINAVFPSTKIYYSFIDTMNNLVRGGHINSWKPIPYDWRKGVIDVVDDKMLKEIKNLALESKTKKLTIITHSNGGLVAKVLMRKLTETNSSHIIEKVINIAVPELGTPEAILSMLHGHNQSILGGSILTKDNARMFSQNMPGAYGLVPSKEFFEKNPINIILNTLSGGTMINTYDAMKKFLVSNIFSSTSTPDTNVPLQLNPYLLSLSESLHSYIDNWKPASTTNTLSIFGWGRPTTTSVKYISQGVCDTIAKKYTNEQCKVKFEEVLTKTGDGTVVIGSNSTNADSTLYFDMNSANKDRLVDVSHANILESPDVLSKVKDEIVKTKSMTQAETTVAGYEKYFSNAIPVDNDIDLTIYIHSPVDIDVYDSNGGHIGPAKNPYEWSEERYFEKTIRNSYFSESGTTKVLRMPYLENVDYQIILSGTDVGTFTADILLNQGDIVLATTSFSEMPVTPLMNVDFLIPKSKDTFAIESKMFIDIDGDGLTDITNYSDTFLNSTSTYHVKDVSSYIEFIRKTIVALKLPPKMQDSLLKRLDKVINSDSGKFNSKKIMNLVKRLSDKKFKKRTLTIEQKSTIIKVFEDLITELEKAKKDKKID